MKNIRSQIFDFSTVKRPAVQGSLLVAEPFLRERYFLHGVVSMIDVPETQASMGVVLNNCTALLLSDVLNEVPSDIKAPVYCGGPLSQDRLFFIHTLGSDIIPDASEYAPGMYIGGDFDAILDYVRSGYPLDGNVRFFLGYSGWDASQLQNEIQNEVWAVADPAIAVSPSALLTMHGDHMWHHVVRAMGSEYRTWNFHPAAYNVN